MLLPKAQDDLLDRVLTFLSAYSWVYSFKWTELLTCAGDVRFDPVASCAADWAKALCHGRVDELQVSAIPVYFLLSQWKRRVPGNYFNIVGVNL